jgi:flagellar basal body-associated protein FliL
MSDQEHAQESGLEDDESSPSGGRFPLLVIVAGALIGLGLGAVMLGPVAAPLLAGFGGGGGEDEEGGGHGAEDAPVTIHVVDNMVVNPAGTGGRALLLTSIAIDVGDETRLVDEIIASELELRGRFIYVFGRRTVTELADIGLREAIKTELKAVIEEVIGQRVQRVFLPQFVLQ